MNEQEKGALDEFNDDFPVADQTADPFAVVQAPVEKTEEVEEELPKEFKNRHIRRVEAKLQAEREYNIAQAERIKVLTEMQQFDKDTEGDPDIAKIYGTDTPEAREATRILQTSLQRMSKEAEERAVQRFQEIQESGARAQREAESFIDDELEALEESYNVDLTSDAPAARKARREFLQLVQKTSPKDEDGNIKDYADFDQVFDLYRSSREKPNASRNKDLAARSMVRSGASDTTKVATNAQEDYLRSQGII